MPARLRVGFATYFTPGYLEDHWVCEYHPGDRWRLLDPELAPRVRDVPAAPADLHGTLEWASRARGSLLLEHSGLAREREEVVREATELLASVLGEPLNATAVAGVRERLARALAGPSS